MGGGVGGMLYSLRGSTTVPVVKYSLSSGRGDNVAQADQGANLTWTASYEAYSKRTKETGTNQDKQRANSKDEDPTGLLNEGFRYRDIETGVWLSRDPAGFVDGPNLYAYVKQNPWSKFDPLGLAEIEIDQTNPAFAAAAQAQMNGETGGSPTARNLQAAAHALPNKIKVVPQSLSSPAQTNTDKDGNIIIRFNPRNKTDATMSHELSHAIQQGTSHNAMQEKLKNGGTLTGPDIDAATEAGRNALNKIVPVKSAKDVGQESKENEAMRVSNIVNVERTATDMKKNLPLDAMSGAEIRDTVKNTQATKESTFHQNNQAPMPSGTKYGSYNFDYVKSTLGLDSKWEKPAKSDTEKK